VSPGGVAAQGCAAPSPRDGVLASPERHPRRELGRAEVIALSRGLKGAAQRFRAATTASSVGYLMTVSFGALRAFAGVAVAPPVGGPVLGGVGEGAPGPPGAESSSPKIIPWPVSRA